MASTPTTKSQVQAYRFMLRRMESALVRKDSVMLHDPMRTHSRATAAGLVLGVVILAGFLIVGLIFPNPKISPSDIGIVVGKQSGSVYVSTTNPQRLIPTFNIASARLLVLALNTKGNPGAAAGGQTQGPPSVQFVNDTALQSIPRERLTGIPDGPQLMPEGATRAKGTWGVCDETDRQTNLGDPVAKRKITTTAIGGAGDLGRELAPDQALYVQADDGKRYLIYRNAGDSNDVSRARRAEVNPKENAAVNAFRLVDSKLRRVSTGFINAIPPGRKLDPPVIPEAGKPSAFGLPVNVGGVFLVQPTAVDIPRYYVVLPDGVQEVDPAVGDLVRYANAGGASDPPKVEPAKFNSLPMAQNRVVVDGYPKSVPKDVLEPSVHPVACFGWNADTSDPKNPRELTKVTVGTRLPIPDKAIPVSIGQASPDGIKVDAFWMPPGRAAAVHSAKSREDFGTGPIYLVSDRGIRFGVPSTNVADAIGLKDPDPAPESILRLLPSGSALDPGAVQRSFDTVPVPEGAGQFPTTTRAGG
jgi:type VII secretion protein EccB